MTYSSKKDPTSHCFSTILQTMVCGRSIPTHPSPSNPPTLEKHNKITTFSNLLNDNDPNVVDVSSQIHNQIQIQTRTRTQGPGLVARLMGLESLPENNNNSFESLFRSKSLNSLHFYSDFDPTRGSYHRRTRTSTSFHEQGHNSNLLVKINENVEHNSCLELKKSQMGCVDSRRKMERTENNVVKLKVNEKRLSRKHISEEKIVDVNKKRVKQGFSSSSSSIKKSRKNNVGGVGYNIKKKNVMEKKKSRESNNERNLKVSNKFGSIISSKISVDNKEDLNAEFQSDAISRSPVSVLEHHHVFDSPTKEDDKKQVVTSNSRRKLSRINDKKHKLAKSEQQLSEYYVDLLVQIRKVSEEQLRDPKWMTKYERCKAHYIEEFCGHLGEQFLDLLLLEFVNELYE